MMDIFNNIIQFGGAYVRQKQLENLSRQFNKLYVDKKKDHLILINTGTQYLTHHILSDIVTQSQEDTSLASLTIWDFNKRLQLNYQKDLADVYQHYKTTMGNMMMDIISFSGAQDPIERLQAFAEWNGKPNFHAFTMGPYVYPENPWTDHIGKSIYTRQSIRNDPSLEQLYQFANWCDEDHKRF